MAAEPLQCKILVLRVSIHCEGCKKKVKRVLQSVDGVYRCDIDARSNKVTVAATENVGADALVKRLRRSGKNAEQWPEKQQQQQQPAGSTQSRPREAKKQGTEPDKAGDSGTGEKPACGDAETSAAEQSNSRTSPEDPKNKTAQPALDGTESTSADADGAVEHATNEATAEQCSGPTRSRKQQQQPEEEEEEGKPSEAMVVVTAQSSHSCHLPPPEHQQQQQPPVHVVSYSVARPSASAASYYAAAPAASAPSPQELPYTYPPCCYYPHSSPYHGSWAPQTGAPSPARDSYSDLFSDDNANSCTVM